MMEWLPYVFSAVMLFLILLAWMGERLKKGEEPTTDDSHGQHDPLPNKNYSKGEHLSEEPKLLTVTLQIPEQIYESLQCEASATQKSLEKFILDSAYERARESTSPRFQ